MVVQGPHESPSTRSAVEFYRVASADGASTIRAWAPNTAPPKARGGVMVVAQDQVVRGKLAAAGPFNPVMIVELVGIATMVTANTHDFPPAS